MSSSFLLPKRAYIKARAFLLREGVRPKAEVVIGLNAIRAHFDLHTGPSGDFLSLSDNSEVPLYFEEAPCPEDSELVISRLYVTVYFEPAQRPPENPALCEAIVDTGSPFVLIPYVFHRNWSLRVYRDLGERRYSGLSVGQRLRQPFCEIGLKVSTRRIP